MQSHVQPEAQLVGACSDLPNVWQNERQGLSPIIRGVGEGLWGLLLKELYVEPLNANHVNTPEKLQSVGDQVFITDQDSHQHFSWILTFTLT